MKTPITSLVSTYCRTLTFAICFLVLPIHTLSAEEVIVVYPTGSYGADVNNVQAAIDELSASEEGGIIELRNRNVDGEPTAFNFGTTAVDPTKRWSVTIEAGQLGPIEIRGEYDDDEENDDDEDNDEHKSDDGSMDEPQTTILGGYIPIRMYGGGELTIQHLLFQEAYRNAIWIGASDSITIKNNVFVDTDGPAEREEGDFPRVITFYGRGGDENQITGTITIKDNVIDGAYGWFSDGIASFYTNAETIVANNDIYGVSVGIRLNQYAQPFTAVGNNISVHVIPGFAAAGYNGSCGIGGSPAVTIEDNYIESRDDTGGGSGVGINVYVTDTYSTYCEISNMQIKDNDIVLTDSRAGIRAYPGSVSDGAVLLFVENEISENSIRGNANYGIALSGRVKRPAASTVELSNNEILRNDLQDLDAKFADIALDRLTSDNLVVAYDGDVVFDRGQNNEVIYLPAESDDD